MTKVDYGAERVKFAQYSLGMKGGQTKTRRRYFPIKIITKNLYYNIHFTIHWRSAFHNPSDWHVNNPDPCFSNPSKHVTCIFLLIPIPSPSWTVSSEYPSFTGIPQSMEEWIFVILDWFFFFCWFRLIFGVFRRISEIYLMLPEISFHDKYFINKNKWCVKYLPETLHVHSPRDVGTILSFTKHFDREQGPVIS